MGLRRHVLLLVVALAVLGSACIQGSADTAAGPDPPESSSPARSAMPPTVVEQEEEAAEPPHPVSLPALMEKRYNGRNLRIRRELGRNDAYVRYLVSYKSGKLTITGLMNVPHGDGPFPVIVLNHGYIDPEVYSTGRGFERSQDFLPRNGFAILHIDYRNHAGSDDDPDNGVQLRLGYTEDAINAVRAIKRSSLPSLDRERVGMLGRSMGGGVALNVAVVRPGIVDAMVIFSSVSSDTVDNFNKWTRPRRALARQIIRTYGSPKGSPEFWANTSPRTFFDRVSVPLLMHQGTVDDTTPPRWARATVKALRGHGAPLTYRTYEGEGHAFGTSAYVRAMRRTVAFFERHL